MLFYIYKICCDNCEYIYVGSTRAFRQRKSQHKTDCNNEKSKRYNLKLYKTIRENGGWENWRMICIDEIEVENKRQAEMKEEECRQTLNGNLNSKRCYATEEENKETLKQCMKEYYEKNKDNIAEKGKKYRENNKDKIKQIKKEWNNKNKDKINERKKEKITCKCGCKIIRNYLSKHLQTNKHKNIIENK